MSQRRDAWIEVEHSKLAANLSYVKDRAGVAVCAVVKANAYGHGAAACAKTFVAAGAEMLAVITVDEGIELREAGVDVPILLLHEPRADRLHEVIGNRLTPTVFTENTATALSEAAARAGTSVDVHLKIDTGLNRLGVPWRDLPSFIDGPLASAKNVDVVGAFTHFAFADEPINPVLDLQLSRFADSLDQLQRAGIEPQLRHAANSAATLGRSDAALDMVRPGVALYGLTPGPQVPATEGLQPALSLKARVAMVKRVPAGDGASYAHRWIAEKPTTIATIPLGYADGWARALTNNAEVLAGGIVRQAIGTVTMDSFIVDMGDDEVALGDEVVLIGTQGGSTLTADGIAERIDTINYEIVTRLSNRLPREHLN